MIVERLAVGPLQTNCYVLGCPTEKVGAVIDPGAESARVAACVERHGLALAWILDTHGHGDHIGGQAALKERFPEARIAIHRAEADSLTDPERNLSALMGLPFTSPPADQLLEDGDTLALGRLSLRVLHVPGHSPGGVAFYVEDGDGRVCFTGDALFAGGIGRADLPGGDHAQLLAAIRERLFALPDDTVCHPGHMEATTIGRERATNPFLA